MPSHSLVLQLQRENTQLQQSIAVLQQERQR